MKPLVLFFLIAAGCSAAVDGTVVNRTTGKPQPGATVTLFRLGQAGPESLESVKSDAQGKFVINQTIGQEPHLIETAFDGVTYNHMLPPGAPHHDLELEVFHSQSKPGTARIAQRIIFLEPAAGQLAVNEAYLLRNDGKLAYNDPDGGTLRFYLPEAAGGKVNVMGTAPQGMPVQRAAEKTNQANIFKVDFPIKPGETRIDLSYSLPLGSPAAFSTRSLYKDAPTRLVAPAGVTLEGDKLESLGEDPTMRASIYEAKGAEIAVRIQGTGSLRAAEPAEDAGPSIEQIMPRVYESLPWILGTSLLILLLGFILLYRMSPAAQPAPSTPARGKRRE